MRAHAALMRAYREEAHGVAAGEDQAGVVEDLFWSGERLRREYLELLPEVALSRCPHSGAELVVRLDTFDLDGLWWAYQTPLRQVGERPPTLVALTGAVRLGTPVPRVPFLVKPGPEAPYVLPRLLGDPAVVAVVSEVPIGQHTGVAVAYFSGDPEHTIGRANEWGANGFARAGEDGAMEWGAVPEGLDHPDFELRGWLEDERLLWIAPGDAELQLRRGAESCPYIDRPGRRDFLRLDEDGVR